ncbi:lysergyl peptide synthetase [Histoplasma capsulatum G186AR]|uniref:Lysergyl peptide synthetase n=1 Tax=Ajellomyces capsulatus TaxID=5037 RepID=A0A8H7YHB8_AJECA|nr:lysergyl peptide synthetase [Histoplasma capsulatum]QSS68449.1 lysergyl peptide synthetase [Histoplasma capsulatum G186AR]
MFWDSCFWAGCSYSRNPQCRWLFFQCTCLPITFHSARQLPRRFGEKSGGARNQASKWELLPDRCFATFQVFRQTAIQYLHIGRTALVK